MLQVIFHKRASNYWVFLRKMSYKDKASLPQYIPTDTRTHAHSTQTPYMIQESQIFLQCLVHPFFFAMAFPPFLRRLFCLFPHPHPSETTFFLSQKATSFFSFPAFFLFNISNIACNLYFCFGHFFRLAVLRALYFVGFPPFWLNSTLSASSCTALQHTLQRTAHYTL